MARKVPSVRVTIWRKTIDGAWRVAVDIGNEDDAEKAPVAGP